MYLYGLRLLTIAVSVMLNMTALALAPVIVSMTPQFRFHTQKGRMTDLALYATVHIKRRTQSQVLCHGLKELSLPQDGQWC